jgi:hypothetical protein
MKRGARSLWSQLEKDEHGEVEFGIYTYGETGSYFCERKITQVFSLLGYKE